MALVGTVLTSIPVTVDKNGNMLVDDSEISPDWETHRNLAFAPGQMPRVFRDEQGKMWSEHKLTIK